MLEDADVRLLLELANLACHKGFVVEARALVDGVLAERPDFVPAKITEAYSHLVVDDFATALELIEPVLAANPEDKDAILVKGMVYLLQGQKDEAQAVFANLPEDCPQHALASELTQAV